MQKTHDIQAAIWKSGLDISKRYQAICGVVLNDPLNYLNMPSDTRAVKKNT
ncbi:hypothetical protein PPTG_20746 [Phytophthora nicotianae INRA-310]|uniref:Uncharacterized protein n=1 Tax=Phytophthora nicotianae (strain INRA-310) TaxID=761204 RepID=W2RF49_PHYN3|nr:hypothetical protein PPTG_20746 [Phytophthora nicotianae INRA-310]ETN24012.1 hypothetical protein PPTG_20746 [Phytophthora nicotianae INRA-310]